MTWPRGARSLRHADRGAVAATKPGRAARPGGPSMAIGAPSASNAWRSVDGRRRRQYVDVDVDITDGTFIVEDAAAAIRGYAEDGFDW